MTEGKKRVLMLLSNPYRPDARVYNEARTLVEQGHEVTILAWDREGRWPKQEKKDGIEVIRVGPKSKRGKKLFILDLRRFWKNAYSVAMTLQFDVVHAHDFDTLPLGTKLKKKKNAALVFDAHEIYSKMIRIDVSRPVARMVQMIENVYLRRVDRVITVIEGHIDFYRRRVGDRVTLVMNAKNLCDIGDEERNRVRRELGIEENLSFIFIGSLEERRFIHEMIEASRTQEGVKIVIGGYGRYKQLVEEAASDNSNLVYLGFVHPDMVVPYTNAADMVVAIYFPYQPLTIATKFFDAVVAGTPLLVNEDGDKTTEMVKRHQCGMAIPYDLKAFLTTVETLKSNPDKIKEMRQNILALRNVYSWEVMARRLINLYENIGRNRNNKAS